MEAARLPDIGPDWSGSMSPEEVVQAIRDLKRTMSRPCYRGEADANWPLESGALRRLRKAHGESFPKGSTFEEESALRDLVRNYHRDHLLEPVAIIEKTRMSDLQRLSVLQHHGAATGLLDFTENLLAALWFACEKHPDKPGRVLALDIGNLELCRNARLSEYGDPFGEAQGIQFGYYFYEPEQSLGERIIAQQSVFVIGTPRIPEKHLRCLIIPQQSKGPLIEYLRDLGLSDTVLFPDISGLATANGQNAPIAGPPSPEEHRNRGNRHYQAGRFEEALAAYESYEKSRPELAEPNYRKASALAALKRYQEADSEYTSAIEKFDQPDDCSEGIPPKRELTDLVPGTLHYNRGNVRAATGDHRRAVADFDEALRRNYVPCRDVLHNRGRSKFEMQSFEEAFADFEAASLECQTSSSAIAMGNCKVLVGEFLEAAQHFAIGCRLAPEATAADCQRNLTLAKSLLDALNGKKYERRREGRMMLVETTGADADREFHFVGNGGNNGDRGMVPRFAGESGDHGIAGIVVRIMSPEY